MDPSALPKTYDPHPVEKRWYLDWIEKGYFHATLPSDRPPFCIVIPPPNVTGSLHMGHALNNTLQDILVRYKRMQGFNVLWMPGTDHAGIATQNVVERELAKKKIKRQDLGREKFVEEVWRWKERHGSEIIHQLKRLGASCDWGRERFTMDEGLSRAVQEAFVGLFEKGLIYRDLYLINWCPRCLTALSDLEVEHEETDGHLWYLRYPLVGGKGHLVVATTRPETMLGDTAVAVHPEDERYRGFVGKRVVLPLVNREIPVLADHRVDREFGTGAVKVTPAHDFNDFVLGIDHRLPRVTIFTDDARMNDRAIHFEGLDRFECRKKIVTELEEKGLLEKIEKHRLSIGHCYRCKTVVEPSLSLQWFVRTKKLAEPALEAVRKGRTQFHPEGWTKTYEQWMENIKDWCISRQIWWGHRIPAWYCEGDEDKACLLTCKEPVVGRQRPERCLHCGSARFRQEEDVLDTWFSSALWPFSTLGWPDQTDELKVFYPTSVLVTGFDIIFFWVARMMMMGLEFMGEVPFRDVTIHALVRDIHGQKMSKSKGNVIDPLTVMDRHGTDAFRFTLAALAAPGRDIKLSEEVIAGYRNFCNKIWNAARFALARLEGFHPTGRLEEAQLSPIDRWALLEWDRTLTQVRSALDEYHFDEAAKALYRFFWHTFCDWYLEFSKIQPNLEVLHTLLDQSLKALHPFMPFITEEIWQRMAGREGSLVQAAYPSPRGWKFEVEGGTVDRLIELISSLRAVRGENQIPARALIDPIVCGEEPWREIIETYADLIAPLAHSRPPRWQATRPTPKGMAHVALAGVDLYVPLTGLVDLQAEVKRLEKEIGKLKGENDRRELRLADPNFLERAAPEVVEADRERVAEVKLRMARLEETLRNIS